MKIDYEFYATTEGCYIISDYYNTLVAYKCNLNNHQVIDIDGEDLYIKYLQGNMKFLLTFASKGIKRIGFEREHAPETIKIYDFAKIRARVLNK